MSKANIKMETEVELLELLIKAESGTKTAFAERIGKTRQNINYHIREAEKNNGKLSSEFKHILEDNGLNLFRFKRNPTNDFYQNTLPSSIASEPETPPIMNSQTKIIELLEREIELIKKVKELEQELNELKSRIPQKKESRRHSA